MASGNVEAALRAARAAHRAAPTTILLCALIILMAGSFAGARSLVHPRFHVDIRVEASGEIEVTETIQTQFIGSWNGIYRYIPVDYRNPYGFSYRLDLDLSGITTDTGQGLEYESYRDRHYQVFKIWIPGAVDTTRTIVIRYRVRRALRFFENYDEFYWNVTGDEGAIPIQSAGARIELPEGVTGVRGVGFTGAYGSTEQATQIEVAGSTVAVSALRPLNIREGLTVAVVWDPGLVHRPSGLESAVFFLSSNWIFGVPLLTFALMYGLWHRRGRDPRLRSIVPQYAPPDDLTPAEIGTLLDNSPDLRDITATLVDLAVRGFIVIEELKKEDQWLGLWSKSEYRFVLRRRRQEWPELHPHEQQLLRALFSDDEQVSSIMLSDLQNEFYKDLPEIRNRIFERLIEQRFYPRNPQKVRQVYVTIAAAVFGLGLLLTVYHPDLLRQTQPALFLAGLLTAASVGVFGWFMPVRTLLGTRFLERVLGFEEFLRRVESDRFRRMIKGPEMFEKYLPFAMALGVEKNWAEAFAEMHRQPPDWYRSWDAGGFRIRSFVSDLNRMSAQTASVMTSAPRSSGGSGFSGGSSGGGFGGGGTSGF